MPCRAVDSTGIKVEGEGEWHARKHGGAKRRVWRKMHLGIDEQTLKVRAVEVTGSHIGDAPVLPDLLNQIPADQEIGSVTAPLGIMLRMTLPGSGRRLRHSKLPRCDRGPRRPSRHLATEERQAMESRHRRCVRHGSRTDGDPWLTAQRGPAGIEIPGPGHLAPMEWVSPPEPRRDKDALRQTAGPTAHGARLRSPSRRAPSPHSHSERLYRARNTRHRGRRMSPLGGRGTLAVS